MQPPSVARPIGYTLRRLRHERGLKVAAVASQVGMREAVLYRIEATPILPRTSTLLALARVFDMPLSAVIREWEIDQIEAVASAS